MRQDILIALTLLAVVACDRRAQGPNQAEHPALALVREYAVRDARGEFTGVSPWYDQATEFQQEVPGWDQGAVVRRYEIRPVRLQEDSAVIAVAYDQVAVIGGDGAGGTRLAFRDTTYTETFVVLRTTGGWRIVKPILPSHTSASVVLEYPSLTPEQRSRLRAVAQLGPS